MKLLVSLLLIGFIYGCQDTGGDSTAISAADVALIDSLGLQNLIHHREGKVLLVNVWATWCIPCREEFPDLVKLAKQFDEVDIVGISADFPDEIEEKVVPFLQKQHVNFPVFVQNFERQEDFINMMNQEWSGALPATFIYDTEGSQRYHVIGKQSFGNFSAALKQIQ